MGIKVCVPVPAGGFQSLLEMIHEAERCGADLIEVRLDYLGQGLLEHLGRLGDIVRGSSVPLIATNRHKAQGGRCTLSEELRLETLIKAAEAGFTYVDIELDVGGLRDVVDRIKACGSKVIVSYHIFTHTPPAGELERIVGEESEAGADICKVVTMARDIMDSVKSLIFTYEMSKRFNLVCFAMGEKGLLSRILSPVFGALFTYASLAEGLETAPGQISLRGLRDIYRRIGIER